MNQTDFPPSSYHVGLVFTYLGLYQVQVLTISDPIPDGQGDHYRMIGIQYLNGIRSAIKEEIENAF